MSSLLYELLEDHVHDFASIFMDCGLQTVRYGSRMYEQVSARPVMQV